MAWPKAAVDKCDDRESYRRETQTHVYFLQLEKIHSRIEAVKSII